MEEFIICFNCHCSNVFYWYWQTMSICLTSSHWLQKFSQLVPSHHIKFAETLLSAGTLIVAICYIPSDMILVGSCQSTFSGWLQVKFSRLEIPTLKFITIYCHKGRYFQPARNMAGLVGEATRLRCGCFDFTGASFMGSSWYILECHHAGFGPGSWATPPLGGDLNLDAWL